MSCILRVGGASLDVDALLAAIDLKPYRIWRKGEPRTSRPGSRLREASGMCFAVSEADFREFDEQMREATEFLQRHLADMKIMETYPEVEWFDLDFGIELRDVTIPTDVLRPAFLKAAAGSGVTVCLSHYPHHPDEAE